MYRNCYIPLHIVCGTHYGAVAKYKTRAWTQSLYSDCLEVSITQWYPPSKLAEWDI